MRPAATNPLFQTLVSEIEAEYTRLGHTLGWRFLNVSRSVLDRPTRIALITMNPAGDHIPEDHPPASCEHGASYIVERWGGAAPGQSTLQVQVQRLFGALSTAMGYAGTPSQLLEESLVSQFVPFRSPSFALLPEMDESLRFARSIWSRVLPIASPRLIVCLGRDIQSELLALIPTTLAVRYLQTVEFPTGCL